MSDLRSWAGLSLILAIAGIGVAAYLSYAAFDSEALACAIGNCGAVQSSEYAKIAGIPIAFLGLGMYITLVGLGVLRSLQPDYWEMATFGSFAIVLAGALYAGYLTYIEIWVIEAICQWCVISAILTLGLVITEGVLTGRLLREESARE